MDKTQQCEYSFIVPKAYIDTPIMANNHTAIAAAPVAVPVAAVVAEEPKSQAQVRWLTTGMDKQQRRAVCSDRLGIQKS
ncbi:hypothetical protein O9993_13190 [Vibrio lentus]|nr:hypothetical protein [Vibrio lentus]